MNLYSRIDEYQALIDVLRPFEGDMLKQLKNYYRIGLTWSSNALEGNTLTESETKVVLEDGLTIGGHPLREIYEAVGHGEAYNHMFSLLHDRRISTSDIKALHQLFYKAIDTKNAGIWRMQQIIVSGSNYAFPQPHILEKEMQGLEKWISLERDNYHPVEFAALLHLKFVSIHPFIDGNGRVARLLMNLSLIQDGYLLAIIPPICRSEYNNTVRQYQNKNNAVPFCEFIAERVLESEKEIMRLFHVSTDKIKTHADQCGESLNGFVNRAIDETMERDGGENKKGNQS